MGQSLNLDIMSESSLDLAIVASFRLWAFHPTGALTMIELTLPDMTCGHCVKTVTRTVQQVDATATLEIDLPSHRVKIVSPKPAEAFKAALGEEGYPAA
jgi:copper chaperone